MKKLLAAIAVAATTITGVAAVQAAGSATTPSSESLLATPCRALDERLPTGPAHIIDVSKCLPAAGDVTGVKLNVTLDAPTNPMFVSVGGNLEKGKASSVVNIASGANANSIDIASHKGKFELALGPNSGNASARVVIDVFGFYTGGTMPPFPTED